MVHAGFCVHRRNPGVGISRRGCIGKMQHNICGVDIICLIVYFYKRNEVQIMRTVGTVSRGVRCPVVKEGDDLIRIVTEAIADMGKRRTYHIS